jgi:hypothetical protein
MSVFDAARLIAVCRADPSVVRALGDMVPGEALLDLAVTLGLSVTADDLRRAYAADWLLRQRLAGACRQTPAV